MFYKVSIFWIDPNDKLNFGKLVRVMVEARRKGLDPAEEKMFQEMRTDLRQMGPEVNEVAHNFYRTIAEIIYENSFLLRIAARINVVAFAFKKIVDKLFKW